MQYNPAKLLPATVQLGTVNASAFVEGDNSPYYGFPSAYSVTLTITPQAHSSQETRIPFLYEAGDVNVGDWLGQVGGKAYKITSVNVIDSNNVEVELEDYDLYVLKSDATQSFSNAPDEDQTGVVFEIDEEGFPVLTGISAQISNFPNLSYWTQDIIGRFELYVNDEDEVGITVSVDKNQQVVAATTTDHFVTGIDMDYTPFQDSDVTVKVNGIEVNTGDGDNTDVSYFTDPSDPSYNDDGLPMTARLIRDIQAGDVLIWNPSAAGYTLDPSDDIDIVYQASSNDL